MVSGAASAVTLPIVVWLWLAAPPAGLLSTVALGGFVIGELRRLRLARRVGYFGATADGMLVAGPADGPWRHAGRPPVVMPGVVLGRLADGGAVAVTPRSAGADAFRRLALALRESARRKRAPTGVAPQAR